MSHHIVRDSYSYTLFMSDRTAPDAVMLNRIAYSQDGYFTSRQARESGFSAQLLAHHVRSGRYQRARRGLFRLSGYPGSSREEVRVAWLSVGVDRAVVSHESALELHELSDVIPNAVHLLIGRKDRGIKPPQGVSIHTTEYPLPHEDIIVREGIRVTTPARSIIDAAKSGTQPDQIEMAVSQAISQGLTTPRELRRKAEDRGGRVNELIENAIELVERR